MVSHHFEVARNSFDKRDQDNIQFSYRPFDRLLLNGRIQSLRAIRAAITISYNLDRDCQIETAGVNMASMSDVHRYVLYFSRLLGWSGYLIAAYALWKVVLVLAIHVSQEGRDRIEGSRVPRVAGNSCSGADPHRLLRVEPVDALCQQKSAGWGDAETFFGARRFLQFPCSTNTTEL